MGGRQQRSFPPTASSACHTSPLDNHPNAGRNKWDADPITATVLFLFVLFNRVSSISKRAHSKKGTFRFDHIHFWSHYKKGTFHMEHFRKRAHSVLSTFQKGCNPERAHYILSTFLKWNISFWPILICRHSILITFHKGTFHFEHFKKVHILFWAHFILSTFWKGHISFWAHFKKGIFQKEPNPKRAHSILSISKKRTIQKELVTFWTFHKVYIP